MNVDEIEIADHLTFREIKCHCGCGVGLAHADLLSAWEALRSELERPIRIVSAFRCEDYNARIGGSKTSNHMTGKAFDVVIEMEDVYSDEMFMIYLKAGFGGIGRGNGILHLDVRVDPAFWLYVADGRKRDTGGAELYDRYLAQIRDISAPPFN
jgi:hypothetical protein